MVASVLATGCLPRPQPAEPQVQPQQPTYGQQPYGQQPYGQQPPSTATAQGGVTVGTTQPQQPQQYAAPQPAPVQPVQQPAPVQPAPQPAPSAQPPPFPAANQPAPFPPAQQATYYPQQYQAPQPYPGPQAYPPAAPQAYAAPTAASSETRWRRVHDGEVIADFAIVGTFAALDLLARADFEEGNAIGFTLVAGMAGGGAIGYGLTQKYDVTAGHARATTLGMTLGFANGALLIEPTGWDRSESVLNLLFLGSALGTAGGFIYGEVAKPTPAQSLFIMNLTMLGAATAAFGAIGGSQDGEYGTWENSTLAIGLNGGALAGAIVAPALDWSPKRSKIVMASTVVGALAGGMMAGLLASDDGESRTEDGDIVTGAMTAGLWGGFALGIMMTREYSPDPRFAQPAPRTAVRQVPSADATVAPWVGSRGQLGVMTGGSF